MAFLMLLQEKMRLQRKVSQLTYKQLRASSRKERVTKNIEKVQKRYTKLETNLENQAKMYMSSFKNNIFNQAGLGCQGQMFNPAMGMGYGITSFVYQQAMALATGENGVPIGTDADGNKITTNLSAEKFQECMNAYQSNTLVTRGEDGKPVYPDGIEEADYKAFMACMNQAQMNQQQAQAMCNNMSTQYDTNVSIWLEAQKARLEAEQDAALMPLYEMETEWDMEAQSAEVQLSDAKARLENIKQALSEGIKDSAPTFGLG